MIRSMALKPVRSAGRGDPALVGSGIFRRAASGVGYVILIGTYASISLVGVATLALVEIRQANVTDFVALIATLDQKDFYQDKYFDDLLRGIAADRAQYQSWAASLQCSGEATGALSGKPFSAPAVAAAATPIAEGAPPRTCAQIKAVADDHLNALSLLQEDLLFRKAHLQRYYDQYRDGIRDKDPQLIPVLGLVDSPVRAVALWARMPFELLEMLLLICMGALGGVISVTRCLVDPTTPNLSVRDLCYRPAAGAVIALGIYVLFRAVQLFFGGGDGAATASTSVFLLAALGLAAGFCAREAVAQIERAATRLLRQAENGDAAKPPAGSPDDRVVAGPAVAPRPVEPAVSGTQIG